MAAINGRIAAASNNPYRALELPFPMPPGEQEAFTVAFHRQVAGPLGLVIGDEEHTRAWTVARWAWWTCRMRGLEVRRAEAEREMDGEVSDFEART